MKKIPFILLSTALIVISLIMLFLCIYALPSIANQTARYHPEVAYLKMPVLLGMYATALPFFYALYETFMIMIETQKETPENTRIQQSLHAIIYCAFMIIALYLIGFTTLNILNAMPPIVAVLGFIILCITSVIALSAMFLKTVVHKVSFQ